MAASAPAITGLFGARALTDQMNELSEAGSMFRSPPNKTTATAHQSTTINNSIGFDASRCSSIYGLSDTVRPISREVKFIMKY